MSTVALKRQPHGSGVEPERVVLSPMDRRIEPRLVTRRRVLLGISALALAGALLYGYLEVDLGRFSVATADRLTVSEVRHGTFREFIPLTGTMVPRTTVYLDAVDGGQVTSVHVEEGELVGAGQPLVELKNTNLRLQVIAAEAQLAEQLNFLSQTSLIAEQTRFRNQLEIIEIDRQIDRLTRELSRRGPLIATGGASRGDIDDLAAELGYRRKARGALLEAQRVDEEFRVDQLAQMRVRLDAMNDSLEIGRQNLDNLVITAPFAGQLTLLEAKVGESKAPGERIGQIDEQNAFKVSAFVDEFYLQRVAVGQMATFEAGNRAHGLEVVKIYPDVRNRLFQIDLRFAGAPPELVRRGQSVQLQLEIGRPADTLVLANGAFLDDTAGQWAFVLSEAGDYAERRGVRFGRRNTESVEVLQGLRRGEHVITSSYERFRDVDRIAVRAGD
jgi:HlyD family secretion protein